MARRREVDAVLVVTAGYETTDVGPDDGTIRRFVSRPTALYRCLRCPYTATAKAREPVAEFAAAVRTDHRATCPGLPARTNQKGTP